MHVSFDAFYASAIILLFHVLTAVLHIAALRMIDICSKSSNVKHRGFVWWLEIIYVGLNQSFINIIGSGLKSNVRIRVWLCTVFLKNV